MRVVQSAVPGWLEARVTVAPGARLVGFGLRGDGLGRGTLPAGQGGSLMARAARSAKLCWWG